MLAAWSRSFLKGNSLLAEPELSQAHGIPVCKGGNWERGPSAVWPPRYQSRLRLCECVLRGCGRPSPHHCCAGDTTSLLEDANEILVRATESAVADGRRLGFNFSCSTVLFL